MDKGSAIQHDSDSFCSDCGIFSAKSFDFLDQFGHTGQSFLFAFVFGGHIAFESAARKKLPDAIEVDGLPIVKEVADMSVGRERNCGFDLRVSIGIGGGLEMSDVEIDADEGR